MNIFYFLGWYINTCRLIVIWMLKRINTWICMVYVYILSKCFSFLVKPYFRLLFEAINKKLMKYLPLQIMIIYVPLFKLTDLK